MCWCEAFAEPQRFHENYRPNPTITTQNIALSLIFPDHGIYVPKQIELVFGVRVTTTLY